MTAVFRLWLCAQLPIFVDEAFYFQQSQRLAWVYSDVPGLTAWLIRFGTELFQFSPLAIRICFWFLLSVIPLLLLGIGRMVTTERNAYFASALSCLLPIGLMQGVLALPDAPLSLAILFSWWMLLRASQSNAWLDWCGFGLGLAIGCLAHYRMAVPLLTGALVVAFYPPSRAWLRNKKFWMALFIGAIGALPILFFNVENEFAGIKFQAIDRNQWAFHMSGLWQPIEQVLIGLPIVVVPLLTMFARVMGLQTENDIVAIDLKQNLINQNAAKQILTYLGLSLVLGYFVFGLFADSIRTRLHWPYPGWLALLPLLSNEIQFLWRKISGRWLLVGLAATSFVVVSGAVNYAIVLSKNPNQFATNSLLNQFYPANFIGWDMAAKLSAMHVPEGAILITDNFKTAAELEVRDFTKNKIYVLDDAINQKHGRAKQLAIWQLDQQALKQTNWSVGRLLIEETATKPIDVLPRLYRICHQFARMEWIESVDVAQSRTRFSVFAVTPKLGSEKSHCRLSIQMDLHPVRFFTTSSGSSQIFLKGWAFQDGGAIKSVQARVKYMNLTSNAKQFGPNQTLFYGEDFPGVMAQWPISNDPNHPNVGFSGELNLEQGLEPQSIELLITDQSGQTSKFERRI